ncbi:MAG: alkaline phosphatase family protein [Myxococcota bacterium]|nr:alkaline phosphatase family protein [Myxococcota bacterium]
MQRAPFRSRRLPTRPAVELALATAVLALFAGPVACDDPQPAPAPRPSGGASTGLRVLVVGIDGATFSVIRPLVAQGRLPALAGLMQRGSWAPLRSLTPSRSPAIWTTVATGHRPETHGIDDFTVDTGSGGSRLIRVHDRRTLAVWNIASAFGRSVDVVGWWVTWPAEPVNGRIVSDRVAHTRWESWTRESAARHLTSPPELYDRVRDLVVDPKRPPLAEIEALVPLRAGERRELLEAGEPIPFHWPSVLKFGWTEQRTYEEIALRLLEEGQPDLALFLLIAVDPVSHTTWHYYEPDAFAGVDPAEAGRLGSLVPALYEHDDRVLARMLALADERTVVLVVSDHGFRASGELPGATRRVVLDGLGIERSRELERPVNVGMTGVHTLNGVLIAAGGPVLPGARFTVPPSVADLTPTILALLGLPVAADMDGRVLTEILDPAFLRKHPVRTLPSYETRIARPELPQPEDEDTLRRRYLEALGYIE